MKITTWNVNGYRAVLQKGFKETVKTLAPDILCLQEIKAKIEQLSDEDRKIEGFTEYWNSAIRPGYSGVATYIKNYDPIVSHGLGNPLFDDEGRLTRLDFGKFIVFNIYFPNGQRGHDRVEYKLDFYRELLNEVDLIHQQGKAAIITGDFNTAHNEIDLANPRENEQTSGFLKEEREMIDLFLEHHLKDAYRELYPDKVEYTWWTYRVNARARGIGWRLDYFLVSEKLMRAISNVEIHGQIMGSDHCPVTLLIDENQV